MLNNLKEYIDDKRDEYHINNNYLFFIIICVLLVFKILSGLNINLAIIFSTVIAFYFFKVLSESNKNKKNKEEEMLKNKIKQIRPAPEIIEKYEDIVNFLFSIQDLYVFNPPAYEEMVESIKSFFIVYEESIKIKELAHHNFAIAESKFNNAVNCVHSIYLNSETDMDLNNKINRAFRTLYKLLKKYLDEIELNIKKDLKYNGYDNKTIIIDRKYKPYNYSESSKYTFDMI